MAENEVLYWVDIFVHDRSGFHLSSSKFIVLVVSFLSLIASVKFLRSIG